MGAIPRLYMHSSSLALEPRSSLSRNLTMFAMAHGLQLALQLANCSYTFVAKHGQAITVLVARVVVLFAAVGQTLEGIGGLLLGQR